MSSSPLSFGKDFKPEKTTEKKKNENLLTKRAKPIMKEFSTLQNNTNVENDKDELYDYLQKNNNKNLDRIAKIIDKKEKSTKLLDTPLHQIINRTISTVENISKKVSKNEKVVLSHHDRTYIGVACSLLALIMMIIF